MKTPTTITGRISKPLRALIVVLLLGTSISFAGELPKLNPLNEVSEEPDLKIENWMVNLSVWKSNTAVFYDVIDHDNEIEIESWMLNANYANWEYVELEKEFDLEDWMLNASNEYWIVDEAEAELEVEIWMTDFSAWK